MEMQLEGIILLAVFTLFTCFLIDYLLSNQNGKFSIAYTQKCKGLLITEIISMDPKSNGIYFLPLKAKVYDAMLASGIENIGSYEKRHLDRNLYGGECIEIKRDKQLNIVEMNNSKKLILGIPVNINQASSKDLVLIPGVGEKTAKEIVQFRRMSGPFKELKDLMQIRGIKKNKFERLKKYFCIDCR